MTDNSAGTVPDQSRKPKKARRALWDKKWPEHSALFTSVELTIPFQDADPTGMAWHGNYFRYYDAARVALLGKLDFAYRSMEAIGQFWPIVDTRARFVGSVAYDDVITISAQLVEWEFRLRIYYQIRKSDGTLVNEAWTVQVPVGMQAGLPTSNELLIIGSPEQLVQRIDALIA